MREVARRLMDNPASGSFLLGELVLGDDKGLDQLRVMLKVWSQRR